MPSEPYSSLLEIRRPLAYSLLLCLYGLEVRSCVPASLLACCVIEAMVIRSLSCNKHAAFHSTHVKHAELTRLCGEAESISNLLTCLNPTLPILQPPPPPGFKILSAEMSIHVEIQSNQLSPDLRAAATAKVGTTL